VQEADRGDTNTVVETLTQAGENTAEMIRSEEPSEKPIAHPERAELKSSYGVLAEVEVGSVQGQLYIHGFHGSKLSHAKQFVLPYRLSGH
jgi:hypothetical protein